MLGHLDFTAGPAVVTSLVAAAVLPAVLAVLARFPRLRDRNALQFLASSVIVIAAWLIALQLPAMPPSSAADIATSLMILAGALLVYLEAWGLLSRGYTLGLLLTLFRAKHPMSDAQLAQATGKGRAWDGSCVIGLADSCRHGLFAGKAIASS